jgi:hypothetical protein
METLLNYVDPNVYYAHEVIELLVENGYHLLGWLNEDITTPPELDDWTKVFSNKSGSYVIIISPSNKIGYCVDNEEAMIFDC